MAIERSLPVCPPFGFNLAHHLPTRGREQQRFVPKRAWPCWRVFAGHRLGLTAYKATDEGREFTQVHKAVRGRGDRGVGASHRSVAG